MDLWLQLSNISWLLPHGHLRTLQFKSSHLVYSMSRGRGESWRKALCLLPFLCKNSIFPQRAVSQNRNSQDFITCSFSALWGEALVKEMGLSHELARASQEPSKCQYSGFTEKHTEAGWQWVLAWDLYLKWQSQAKAVPSPSHCHSLGPKQDEMW